jgi:hypothetical protein
MKSTEPPMAEEKITKVEICLNAGAITELSTLGYIPRLATASGVIAAGVAAALENVLTVGLGAHVHAIEPVPTVQRIASVERAPARRGQLPQHRTQRVLTLHGGDRPPTVTEIPIDEPPPAPGVTLSEWGKGLDGPPIAPPPPRPAPAASSDEVGELRDRLAALEAAQKTSPNERRSDGIRDRD